MVWNIEKKIVNKFEVIIWKKRKYKKNSNSLDKGILYNLDIRR